MYDQQTAKICSTFAADFKTLQYHESPNIAVKGATQPKEIAPIFHFYFLSAGNLNRLIQLLTIAQNENDPAYITIE